VLVRVLAAALLSPAPPRSPVTIATCSEALLEARDACRESGCTSGIVLGLTDSENQGCAEDVGRALEETFIRFGSSKTTELFESPNWSWNRALKIIDASSAKIERLGGTELIAFKLNGERTMRIEGSTETRVNAPKSTNRFEGSEETRKGALKFCGSNKGKIEWMNVESVSRTSQESE
jgi:hypothetical protein